MRVLIVEDEALIASYLEALVVSFGYEVCALAASAPEAIENAAIHMPDVVLMDIRLARGTSGIEAARQIYARQGLRCIFLSANLDDASRRTLGPFQPIDAPSRFANGGAPGVFQIGCSGGRGLARI
jgi:two-component system, response regulator PdtaR